MGHSREDRTKRRNIRQAPVLPEDEVPRQTGYKRNKPKHVHRFEETLVGYTSVRRVAGKDEDGHYIFKAVEVPMKMRICKGCGYHRQHTVWYY